MGEVPAAVDCAPGAGSVDRHYEPALHDIDLPRLADDGDRNQLDRPLQRPVVAGDEHSRILNIQLAKGTVRGGADSRRIVRRIPTPETKFIAAAIECAPVDAQLRRQSRRADRAKTSRQNAPAASFRGEDFDQNLVSVFNRCIRYPKLCSFSAMRGIFARYPIRLPRSRMTAWLSDSTVLQLTFCGNGAPKKNAGPRRTSLAARRPADLVLFDLSMNHTGANVVRMEAEALRQLADRIEGPMAAAFRGAVELLCGCAGRVVVTGMGKSGLIARKIAATLSSTGTPALYLHPAEALHGDLGMIVRGDIVIALSASGETEEILELLPNIKRLGIALISFTCDALYPPHAAPPEPQLAGAGRRHRA